MKKLRLLSVFLVLLYFNMEAFSQKGYNILYKASVLDFGLGKGETFTRIVFNNFQAYAYNFHGTKDPMENKGNYGSKQIPHSTIVRHSSSDRFYYYGLKGYKHYWALDTTAIKVPEWIFTDESKEILGYKCIKAYALTEYLIPLKDSVKTYRLDSIIVWYTPDIKSGFAIFNYPGLPGLPLEIVDKRGGKWNYKAIWINKEDIFIHEPKNVMPIEKLRKHK